MIQSGGILVTAYGCVINNPSGTSTFDTLTSGNSDLVVQVPEPGSQLTIEAALVNNGLTPVGLTIAGSGIVTLGQATQLSGPLNLNSGTLIAADLNGVQATLGQNATLEALYSGMTLGSLSGAGTISGETSAPTFIVGQNNASTTFSGVVSATLVKVGTGTLTLSGSNTSAFFGLTILNGGAMVLDFSTNVGPKASTVDHLGAFVGSLEIGSGTVQIIPNLLPGNLIAGGSLFWRNLARRWMAFITSTAKSIASAVR